MPANTSVWIFTQLGGKGRTLKLEDHTAPHGRARKKPVVETELGLREDTVRYSGNPIPTRHLFGTKEGNEVIEGRLDDSRGGKDFARTKKREIESFVRDAQQCSIVWDDLISVIGYIDSVKFGIESGAAISYKLELLIDQNVLDGDFGTPRKDPKGPRDLTNQLIREIDSMDTLVKVPAMRGSIFDTISGLISSVASASAQLYTIAGQIDSFANAPFQLLNQLRAALDQFRTVVSALRTTYDDLEVNIALENQNASSQQAFWDVQSAWAVSSLEAIRLALAMDRAAAIAQQWSIKALYLARDGDTWDHIARAVYNGSANRASEIREINGVQPGADPIPGTEYMVPV